MASPPIRTFSSSQAPATPATESTPLLSSPYIPVPSSSTIISIPPPAASDSISGGKPRQSAARQELGILIGYTVPIMGTHFLEYSLLVVNVVSLGHIGTVGTFSVSDSLYGITNRDGPSGIISGGSNLYLPIYRTSSLFDSVHDSECCGSLRHTRMYHRSRYFMSSSFHFETQRYKSTRLENWSPLDSVVDTTGHHFLEW